MNQIYCHKFTVKSAFHGDYSDFRVDMHTDLRMDFRYPFESDKTLIPLIKKARLLVPASASAFLKTVRVLGNFPGCPQQDLHRDSGVSEDVFAYQVFVPLQAPEKGVGHTMFYQGTHRGSIASEDKKLYLKPELGDAVVFDQAIMHHGTPHHGNMDRFILSFMFTSVQDFHDENYDDDKQLLTDRELMQCLDAYTKPTGRPRRVCAFYS